MMSSLPCESTQKMLSDDDQSHMLPKKASGDDAIIAM